jgi:hypothetical protein
LGAAGEPKQGQAGIKRLSDPVTRGTDVEKATGWSPAYSLLMHRRPAGCVAETTALGSHFVWFSRQCYPEMLAPIGRHIKNININNV